MDGADLLQQLGGAIVDRARWLVILPRTSAGWDNAVAESFFATIKRELISTRSWPNVAAVRHAVFDYIEGWFNPRRLHSSLNYMSPAAYEAHHTATASVA